MSGARRFHAVGLALIVAACGALIATDARAAPPADQKQVDYVQDLIDRYFQGRERVRFYAAAGVDGELTKEEFTAAAGEANSFVRSYDRWPAVMVFDRDRDGRLDWVEAEQYRLALRTRVLVLFDRDRNGRLTGPERTAANAYLAASAGRRTGAATTTVESPAPDASAPDAGSAVSLPEPDPADQSISEEATGAATYIFLAPPMPGDANGDGKVDGADYTLWADHYKTAGGWAGGDFNNDGTVDGADYTIWADNFGTVRCLASKDVWLSAVSSEQNYNMGAAQTIKLKVLQEFGLVDFDVQALAGKVITSAKLYVHPAGGGGLNLNDGTDLRWLTVSTVSHTWVEGLSTGYGTDPTGHGATFNESSYQLADWGWPGAKVWNVILGNGNTLRDNVWMDPAPGRAGWQVVQIDPRLVQALAAGAAHGLNLMDGSTWWGVNNRISARESGYGAYLEVKTGGTDQTPPAAPTDLSVQPAPNWATPSQGAAQVSLTVPPDAFSYNVTVNGQAVERWQIPFAAAPGTTQSFVLRDQPAGASLTVLVKAVDAAGNQSGPAAALGSASPALTVPALPASPFVPVGGGPPTLGSSAVWAFPEVTKVDPVTKAVLREQGATNFRQKNPIWDGATGQIRLAAARGEIVSFQLAIEGSLSNCQLTVSNLTGPGGAQIPNQGVKLWRNWYVQTESEYAIPLLMGQNFNSPFADNPVSGQTLQALTVDLYVPKNTSSGEYNGQVVLTAQPGQLQLPLKVQVYSAVIPDEIHFNPELNCYGGPGTAGSNQFKDSFRLAHYHRCTINRVPYGQSGNVHTDWAPTVAADGHVTNWATFDANLGGLLDGSWFAANPRGAVPVPTLYLPLFEGWPQNFLNHYDPGPGIPINGDDNWDKLYHDTMAKPIEQAMDEEFKTAFKNCAADFVAHFNAKGWNRTIMEFYLNNKPSWGYTMWTLDEPEEYLDWAALNFFGRLYREAVNDPETYTTAFHTQLYELGLAAMNRSRATFMFRGDISRPMWQGNVSDGIMNVMYVGGMFNSLPRLMRDHTVRMPLTAFAYGSCNVVNSSNWQSTVWCLNTFALNGNGVLPWQSLAGTAAMTAYDTNGLIIDAGSYGYAVASFRVHALRRGAQDAELLRLLQLKNGWSREHCGLLVAQKVPLASYFPTNPDPIYGTLTSWGFCEMKEGVLQLLELP